MCSQSFRGSVAAAIRGQQEAHHGRRKENPIVCVCGGVSVGGAVVDEILGHSDEGGQGKFWK